ncbi:MAG TPA: hypothetical protein QKA14_00785 [Candidatus Megaira endosymbiont of Hartmannula sinica]|nr:hypothetical protein [Candidatus Megaera endosymbiont of Hartmannula sinica]
MSNIKEETLSQKKENGIKESIQSQENQPTSYDEVPYTGYPYSQSHPEHLMTLGKLFGMKPNQLKKPEFLNLVVVMAVILYQWH